MKKFFAFVLALTTLFSLVSCYNKSETTSTPVEQLTTTLEETHPIAEYANKAFPLDMDENGKLIGGNLASTTATAESNNKYLYYDRYHEVLNEWIEASAKVRELETFRKDLQSAFDMAIDAYMGTFDLNEVSWCEVTTDGMYLIFEDKAIESNITLKDAADKFNNSSASLDNAIIEAQQKVVELEEEKEYLFNYLGFKHSESTDSGTHDFVNCENNHSSPNSANTNEE